MRGLALLCVVAAGCGKSWDPQEEFPRIAAKLQEVRGVPFDLPKLKVVTREQWIASLPVVKANPDYGALWTALRIVKRGVDSQADYRAVESRARGHYAVGDHEVVYITDTPEHLRERQLAHSLVHALQREKSPLYGLPALGGWGDDVSWAWAAAREAEGVAYELSWPHPTLGRVDLDRLDLDTKGCAPYAVRWAYFGYYAGVRYLLARSRDVRTRAVEDMRTACDRLWKDPPMSTEQVLHPERRDPPVAVFAPDLSAELGKGWNLSVTTVLGEWTIADWLGNTAIGGGLPDDLRWGGDIAQVYRRKTRTRVFVWSTWDDEASARAFFKRVRGTKVRSGRKVAVTFTGSTNLLRAGLKKLRTVPFRSVEELEAAIESE